MHSTRRTVSVIIPTLDEAGFLEAAIESVECQQEPWEIVVVDGGSVDGTCEIAARRAPVISSKRGRAQQMNAGAAATGGDILLFLHADTRLPPQAFASIRQAFRDPAYLGGTFRLRFDRETPLLRFYSLCTRIRSPLLCFGDRGLFARRDVFRSIGGFPPVPLFEDLELARAITRRGGFAFLDDAVTTSARRFHRVGPLRQQLRNVFLFTSYLAGTDPRSLVHLYPYR